MKQKIIIVQPKIKGRADSFFYEGEVVYIETKDNYYSLIATGDIRINIEEDYITNSNKEEKIDKYKLTDKKLKRLEAEKKLEWLNNNWFEVGITDKKTGDTNYDMGIVEYDYDSATNMLNDYSEGKND